MQRLWIDKIDSDYEQWSALLNKMELKTEKLLDETYGIYEHEKLIATGSIYSNVIKCIAIDENYQGGSVFNELISFLMNRIYENGHHKIYVYTKPKSEKAFSFLGFNKIEQVSDKLVFMENATNGFSNYIDNLKKYAFTDKKSGAIVMNANPFTNGHLYLIEYARKICDIVHIFVVSEDVSVFDFETRKKLIALGTAHLDGIYIHQTNSYMVSAQTFPSYFLKEDVDVTRVQANLDARIFKYHIANALSIDVRFVGEEPFSKTTEIYNEEMQKVFRDEEPINYPELQIIKRLENNNSAISASTVRKLIATGQIEQVKPLVPPTTYEFLNSNEASSIIEHLEHDKNLGQKLSY